MKDPNVEAFKEVARWAVLWGLSAVIVWITTTMLEQVTRVPEVIPFNVWVFSFEVPFRFLLVNVLTFVGRYADKYAFIQSQKMFTFSEEKGKGVLPF